jgi:large subunit ribosomal protein L34
MITFFGTRRKAVRVSGFRARLKTQSGRKILKNRRKKGRKLLSIKGKR